VPLIFKPAARAGAAVRKQVVNTLDLYGTVLELAGLPDWKATGNREIEARSLLPLLREQPGPWENRTCSIIGKNRDAALCMLRQDDLKLIRLAQGDDQAALYELYDLCEDPLETKDISRDPAYAAAFARLKEDLDRWFSVQ
jgi:choline-sulfatase